MRELAYTQTKWEEPLDGSRWWMLWADERHMELLHHIDGIAAIQSANPRRNCFLIFFDPRYNVPELQRAIEDAIAEAEAMPA